VLVGAKTIDFSAAFMFVVEESKRLMNLQIPDRIPNSMAATIANQSIESIEMVVGMG
jgi:hypothetical protein